MIRNILMYFMIAYTAASHGNDFKLFDIWSGLVNNCPLESVVISTDNTSCQVRPISCEDTFYRTFDGSCNNFENGWWGTPLTPYKRLIDNNYFDGTHEIAKDKRRKRPLPNPREISLRVFSSIPKDDKRYTLAFMQYAQVISHDLALTANVIQLRCCSQGQPTQSALTNTRCDNIPIPKDDPFNGPAGRTCMNFARTEATGDRNDCIGTTSVSEPLNQVTSFLDASYLYGSDEATANSLRAHVGGRLLSFPREGTQFLPQDPNAAQTCFGQLSAEPCYKAGDARVNQNPQLALLQNIFMVNHNNIADELAQLNPQWTDEKIFQEARRIVIASHQHILYYEMLPKILDKRILLEQGIIYPVRNGYINDYDPTISPAVTNEFSAAAFRFFHTEIQSNLKIMSESRNMSGEIKLQEWMNKPSIIESGDNFRGLSRGLTTQMQAEVDTYFTKDVLNFVFKDGILGQDMKAVDIMRGRDHGLPPYAKAVEKCCLGTVKNFKDLEKFMKRKDVRLLSTVYDSVEDIDLIVGMSFETLVPGALCGPVTCSFLADQFHRSRKGDRYFFENNQHKSAFKLQQLNAIRKISFANLMCQVPGIQYMQERAFEHVTSMNDLKSCDDIPKLDLTPWKEDNEL